MKKVGLILYTAIIMASVLLPLPARAAAAIDKTTLAPRGGDFVIDETGTLTGAQTEGLNKKAAAIMAKRQCAVYIWIVDLVPEIHARTIDSLEAYVDAFYEEYDLGYGDDRNGIVLLLEIGDVPGERDYLMNTHGASASVFEGSTMERVLDDHVVPLFKVAFLNGNFYNVADVFLDEVESEFALDYKVRLIVKLADVILVPAFIAWIVCWRWKRRMKTAALARTADNYIPVNGFRLTGQQDTFLYRTVTSTMKPKSSSPSGGGGSSSSSSGRSMGGKV